MGKYGKCLDVKITNTCNGKCPFCIEKDGYAPQEVSVQELIKATNLLTDYKKVLILGGEPFLYPYLEQYLIGISPYKDEIYITTNGSAFNFDNLGNIAKRLKTVNISLMHYDLNKNATLVGPKIKLSNLVRAIEVFQDNNVSVRINVNLIKGYIDTKEKIDKMIAFAKTIQANSIRFAELQGCPGLYVSAEDLFENIHKNPYCEGCEQAILGYDIDVNVRLTCGIVNCLKSKIHIRKKKPTKVLYPNSIISNGWKNVSGDCHSSNGCH
jgi:molybdenum cofactor biosynthesis enzyme MoaA